MKLSKKLGALLLAAAMVFTLSIPAFAASGTKSVTGYGTLRGTLTYSSSSSKVRYTTSVTQNPDNATLGYKVEYVNKAGDTLATDSSYSSNVVKKSGSRSSPPSNTSMIYSTHEVKGGSKYSAAALYLSLSP